MRPNKIGQVVRFHTPLPDENPSQQYVILQIHQDVERPRAYIQALHTGLSFDSVSTVFIEDLETVEVDTTDLIGYKVAINKTNGTQESGIVVKVCDRKIMPELTLTEDGVETNVALSVLDKNGTEHSGLLLVK